MLEFKQYITEASPMWFGFKHLPSTYNPDLKSFMDKLSKFVKGDDENIYIDGKYNFKKGTTQLTIKITDKSLINKIVKDKEFSLYGFKKVGERMLSSNMVNVALYPSGGDRGSGRLQRYGETQSIPSTAEQEMGTIVYFEAAFKGIKLTAKEISDKVGYSFDLKWMHNFEAQYDAFKKNIGILNNAKIYLDSDKNESNIIVNLAKKFGLKDSKDNWNPADIWIMTISGARIKAETKDITTLAEYNAYLVEKYDNKQIIGVSLKKIAYGKAAKFKRVTANDLPMIELKPSRVLFDPYQKNFIFETDGNIKGFNLRVGYKASSITKVGDIRIYLEGRQKGASVQLGGVSAKLFTKFVEEYGFNIANDKTKIMNNPLKYINDTLPGLLRHPAVVDKVSGMPDSELQLQSAAFLVYYLEILLKSDNDLLKACYYSSSKMNDFSSIHCKLY